MLEWGVTSQTQQENHHSTIFLIKLASASEIVFRSWSGCIHWAQPLTIFMSLGSAQQRQLQLVAARAKATSLSIRKVRKSRRVEDKEPGNINGKTRKYFL